MAYEDPEEDEEHRNFADSFFEEDESDLSDTEKEFRKTMRQLITKNKESDKLALSLGYKEFNEILEQFFKHVSEGDISAVKKMMEEHDLSVDTTFKEQRLYFIAGETCINHANSYEMVKFLLDKGADPNSCQCITGLTPLMVVKDPKIAELLIERGADIKGESKEGIDVFSHAAINQYLEVFKFFVNRGFIERKNLTYYIQYFEDCDEAIRDFILYASKPSIKSAKY